MQIRNKKESELLEAIYHMLSSEKEGSLSTAKYRTSINRLRESLIVPKERFDELWEFAEELEGIAYVESNIKNDK